MESLPSPTAGQLFQSLTAGLFSRFPSPFIHVRNPSLLSPTPSPQSRIGSLSRGVRIDGLNSGAGAGAGGPAFVGQVFSMLDPTGTGLMAVTEGTVLDSPFVRERLPGWIKNMFDSFNKNEDNGPVFRFFMDLSDAAAYVQHLEIPTGKVGACRLDVAYKHFKEKPNRFQFVPNARQVKAANKLLKENHSKRGPRKLDGVPVFTAQNLNIAVATDNGIKWYTPYFFDKSLLDNILEASVDQHFHTMIQTRRGERRGDVLGDNFTSEAVEENGENLFEPPEVEEVLDEMDLPSIPLSVISKVAEIKLLDVVDKVMLGNKWLRKATGIQPKFPYLVDSFETRSAASVLKATTSTSSSDVYGVTKSNKIKVASAETALRCHQRPKNENGLRFPFRDWLSDCWFRPHSHDQDQSNSTESRFNSIESREHTNHAPPSPFFPVITMVGISNHESGKASRANLKKRMEDLTRELERNSQKEAQLSEDKDPLFVANVGDYSTITRVRSA